MTKWLISHAWAGANRRDSRNIFHPHLVKVSRRYPLLNDPSIGEDLPVWASYVTTRGLAGGAGRIKRTLVVHLIH